MTDLTDLPTHTVKTYLRPIDRDELLKFADAGRENPTKRGTNKVHTVMEGQYRSFSYVADHHPVVVDEPLHLFGQNTAAAPGEIMLSALGGCLAVGIAAVATWKQVKLSKLELFLEGDATREVLDEIVKHANMFSPVANSVRNPIPFEIALA